MGTLLLAGGCQSLGNATLMQYGFVEVRVRGQGIDTTCRADVYYRYAGKLNSTLTGWLITGGWAPDDPRWGTSTPTEPDTWCNVRLQTKQALTTGAIYRTDSPDDTTRLVEAGVFGVPEPYNPFANSGLLRVDEATAELVKGNFELTLPRLKPNEGPPLRLDGRFEVRRNP